MKSKLIKVSLLYGSGSPNPEYREFFAEINNLRILQEARDPETFLAQQEEHPDLVLVDLNGSGAIPGWLDPLVEELGQTKVMVCSHSRDPDFLIRIMKLRVGGFIPLPLDREEFLAIMERIRTERAQRHIPSHGQILAVTGTKGGVGITSVATNLAVALAEIMPEEILLVDLARPFPQVGQFLDLRSSYSMKDLEINVHNLDHIFLKKIVQGHKSQLGVLLGSPDYTPKSSMVQDIKAIGQILRMLCNSYRWVVVDLGVWLDPFYARVLQEADQILLVSELSVPDLQNLKVLKSFFHGCDLQVDKVKVLVNRYEKNYALGLGNLEEIMQQPVFHTLPNEPATLKEAINQGEPLSEVAPRSKLWRQFKDLAVAMAAQSQSDSDATDGAKAGLLWRLFSSKGGNGNGMAIGR